MAGRALPIGPTEAVQELVTRVLRHTGLVVEVPSATGAEALAADSEDILVVIQPGEAEWEVARHFEGGVVVVSEHSLDDSEMVEAILAGADAVLHLDDSPAEMAAAVVAVGRGATLLEPQQVRHLAEVARKGSARRRPSPRPLVSRSSRSSPTRAPST